MYTGPESEQGHDEMRAECLAQLMVSLSPKTVPAIAIESTCVCPSCCQGDERISFDIVSGKQDCFKPTQVSVII